jgi:hypothetical protein
MQAHHLRIGQSSRALRAEDFVRYGFSMPECEFGVGPLIYSYEFPPSALRIEPGRRFFWSIPANVIPSKFLFRETKLLGRITLRSRTQIKTYFGDADVGEDLDDEDLPSAYFVYIFL